MAKTPRRRRTRAPTASNYQATFTPKRSHEEPTVRTSLPRPPAGMLTGRLSAATAWVEKTLGVDMEEGSRIEVLGAGRVRVRPRWSVYEYITIEPMEG